MSLFQTSVLKQHLSLQDKDVITKAYKKYTKYFLNPTIQDNIRSSKEEEYQGIFLTELFVNILGYTLKPNADFNLVAEYKNQTNARKADGAILNNDVAIGVIELKGTNTKDLESIRKQAFDYKANQKGCVYVITSNFEKLRFYINDATEFEEFNLFELSPERFALFYLCLQKDNVIQNVPLKIKEASVVEEEQITKQFYKDYSLFKRELYRDLVKRNAKTLKTNASLSNVTSSAVERSPEEIAEQLKLEKNVKLTLFKKSQKLIDRYLFIFFAEDRGLLPPNSTQQILDKWKADVDFGDDRPLYVLFKQYFNFLDQGRAGTSKRAEIYAYNGGLFKEDKTLDSLEIDNDLLYKHTSKLAAYDFESQVDVNILGHIFENSLNEIESVNAEIEGGDFDKQKSKRKKDGVFYTPKYITKYIVENTIGKLCDEKKTELGFKEEEYFKGRKNRQKATITKLVTILDDYRDWLLQLTICDPACGSGAFLNQALDFLIKEHTYIDELKTKVLGGGLQFPDIENTILENNIYGVDLNEESVEIAKLSLWLRTAQPRRKLNDLSSNIKCGNSLIDSKAVAGDKAFNWEEQFSKVFEKGGFDVVIGNPPYVRQELLDPRDKEWLSNQYQVGNGTADLYVYFYEKGIDTLKNNGVLGFITPNKFYKTRYGKDLRQYLKDIFIYELIDFFELPVFEDASTDSQILIAKNFQGLNSNLSYKPILKIGDFIELDYEEIEVSQADLNTQSWVFNDAKSKKIIDKLYKDSIRLIDFCSDGIYRGVVTGLNKAFIIDKTTKNKIIESDIKSAELIKPYLNGTDYSAYSKRFKELYLITTFPTKKVDIENYPGIKTYLLNYGKEKLIQDGSALGRKKTNNKWFETQDSIGYYKWFECPKIIYIYTAVDHGFYFDSEGMYVNNSSFIIPNAELYLSAFLNSSLFKYFKRLNFVAYGNAHSRGRVKLDFNKMIEVPIRSFDTEKRKEIGDLVPTLKGVNNLFDKLILQLQNYFTHTYSLNKLSKKLQNWHELEFGDFIKELNKAIKANNKLLVKEGLEETPTLTKKDEFEWLDLFEDNKQKAQALQTQINQTDKEINAMVYELYGLTEDEIAIVENS
ncbi:DNA methyltransferase [Olleya sp.]|jgi:type I restriction-modification system DNA methylase subunit|uniref:Eco57I restriction-modification methylase domain-containing protein n=1 Tax=Olleya sp. TaxID=1906788 RepID=UPI0032D947BA